MRRSFSFQDIEASVEYDKAPTGIRDIIASEQLSSIFMRVWFGVLGLFRTV